MSAKLDKDTFVENEREARSRLAAGCMAEQARDYRAAVEAYRAGLKIPRASLDTQYFLHNNLGYSLQSRKLKAC